MLNTAVTDYAKSFCGLGNEMQRSHNADQTKKSFEYSVCLHLALMELGFYLQFPCRNPPVKMERPLFFSLWFLSLRAPLCLHYLCCRVIELSTRHLYDSSIYICFSVPVFRRLSCLISVCLYTVVIWVYTVRSVAT